MENNISDDKKRKLAGIAEMKEIESEYRKKVKKNERSLYTDEEWSRKQQGEKSLREVEKRHSDILKRSEDELWKK